MGWRRARFKDQEVWASVGATGELDAEGGRVPIRYQPTAGAKIYRASASRVVLDPAAPIEALDAGISADAPAATAPKGSQGRSKTPSSSAPGPSAGGSSRSAGRADKGMPGGFGKAGSRTAEQIALAAEAAQALVRELEGAGVLCFTDGACKGNPGAAGSGAAVWLPDGRRGEASRALGRATNNIAELTAIGLALELLDDAQVPLECGGAILTDSAYAHGVLVRGWKAKANQGLVSEVKSALARRPGLALHWIAGHVGIEGNERADMLANLGVSGVSKVRWSD